MNKSRKRKSNQNSSLEVSLSVNVPGRSTRDDSDMFVITATGQKGLDRKSYCMYCQTMQSKFVRHLQNKHKDVEEVRKFADLPNRNPERLKIIETIRKKCMFDFNTNNVVINGELMVCRRPSQKAQKPQKTSRCANIVRDFSPKPISGITRKNVLVTTVVKTEPFLYSVEKFSDAFMQSHATC